MYAVSYCIVACFRSRWDKTLPERSGLISLLTVFLEVSIVAAFVGSAGLSVALLERQTTEWPCFDSVNDRTFAFRLVPGSDLLDSLNNFTVEHSMHAGKVVETSNLKAP